MDLVIPSEAARQVGIHPSQITRGLQSGLFPNRGLPERPLVNVEEVREARARGLDRSKQRGRNAPLFAAVRQAAPAPAVAGDEAEDRDPTYQGMRARREAAAAGKAEIELARLRGETLDRGDVVENAFAVGQGLREGMETRRAALAQRLVGLQADAIMAILAEADEAHLVALADEIAKRFAPEEIRVAA